MKKENGVTLISLIVYVIAMVVVVAIIGTFTAYFYDNMQELEADSSKLTQYNKFNMFFLEDVKNNDIEKIGDDKSYIIFKNQNSYIFQDNSIYLNKIKICNNIESLEFTETEKDDNKVLKVKMVIEDITEEMEYKVN